MGAQTRVQTGLGSAPSTHHSPPYPIRIANPSPPTPAASDELNWIIDLLEKEDATSQDTFLDSSHLGKRRALAKPFPQGAHAGAGRADSFFTPLPLPELGNPCAKDSLEDMKPPNPFLSTDFTCLPDALSPGSSDISGQCFALPLPCSALGDPSVGNCSIAKGGFVLALGCPHGPAARGAAGDPRGSILRLVV